MTEDAAPLGFETVVELLHLRGCAVVPSSDTDRRTWVSYTSLKGHRWAVISPDDTQQALDFLTQLNTEGI